MPLITACLCLKCLCIWYHVLRTRITCITNYLCLSSLYSIDCNSEDLRVSCLLFLYQKHTDKLRYPTHFRKQLLWVNKNRYSLDPPGERLHYFFLNFHWNFLNSRKPTSTFNISLRFQKFSATTRCDPTPSHQAPCIEHWMSGCTFISVDTLGTRKVARICARRKE